MRFLSPLAFLGAAATTVTGFVVPTPHAAKTVVKGTPFQTIDGVTAVEDASTAGLSVFEKAMYNFGKNYPVPYARGLGPTTNAERWNGRHAMAGWVTLLATGYAQAHGLLPEGQLDPAVWGQWVITSTDPATQAISTIPLDRATILIAHLHLAAVGVFSAFSKYSGPFEKLLLENGEKDEPAAGLFVPFRFGLSREAELLNGRLAMLGLLVLGTTAAVTGDDFLVVIDKGLGGLLLA